MANNYRLIVHGRGNAWPVSLGGSHPFYDRTDPQDLSNAAFSLVMERDGQIQADILVDAGHGTIQSLISGVNRIPGCICLTHGHMDHTLSVDWVVQSYWQQHNREKRYPVYATLPVYEFLVQSYPQLRDLIQFNELVAGITSPLTEAGPFRITSYPVYHGNSAFGASMLLFETDQKRVLFTGDILTPLLHQQDYPRLREVDLLVVDTNNRFPWPRTNHWSFAGSPDNAMQRSGSLTSFLETLSWDQVAAPHRLEKAGRGGNAYFQRVKQDWSLREQPFTVVEFLRRITPRRVVVIHYSGTEDARYHHQDILSAGQLSRWISGVAAQAGIQADFVVPETGQVIEI